MEIIEKKEFEKSVVEITSVGIVKVRIKDGSQMELKDTMEHHEYLQSKLELHPLLLLVDPGKKTTSTKEVREFANRDDVRKTTKAQALLTKSTGQQLLINFMIRFYNKDMKLKVFSKEDEALIWLLKLD